MVTSTNNNNKDMENTYKGVSDLVVAYDFCFMDNMETCVEVFDEL